MKRILLFSSILFVGIVVGVVVWVQNEGQTAPLSMKEKIEAAAEEIHVQDILQSHSIDDGLEAVLFLLKDGRIGYALVKMMRFTTYCGRIQTKPMINTNITSSYWGRRKIPPIHV
ncbi:hypothetical protein [Rossellomorea marisflavi]|uniref:hypothetical protein n=1 Tax=Rossellomorea marisflavi TaxID=189381 RepID=UPI0012E11629|nr:hypothetical protein [Rossellomorea marisflavi]